MSQVAENFAFIVAGAFVIKTMLLGAASLNYGMKPSIQTAPLYLHLNGFLWNNKLWLH